MSIIEINKVHKIFSENVLCPNLLNRTVSNDTGFVALENITFEVNRGEIFSIIGLNGAGKSTLLQIITGIVKPSSGDVRINGRISSILELGSGFDHNFTGIENIHLYYQMIGNTKKCNNATLDKIIAFSDLEEFINNKLYTYSTGMIARLAFSVRIFAEFDILIIDEILSVGDIIFQKKCYDYFSEIRERGKTIICVSHNINQVLEISDRVCLLDKGKVVSLGLPKESVFEYMHRVNNQNRDELESSSFQKKRIKNDYIRSIKCNGSSAKLIYVKYNEKVIFSIDLNTNHDYQNLSIGFNVRTVYGVKIAGRINPLITKTSNGNLTMEYICELNHGEYFLSFNLIYYDNFNSKFLDRKLDCFVLNVRKDDIHRSNSGYVILKSNII
jgi:teichoic acid transport system ATP-binding protein